MSGPEVASKMITVRLTETQHRELKAALAANGNSIQRMLSTYVDRYIEKFAAPDELPVEEPTREKKPAKVVGFAPAQPLAPEHGCWDHRGSPKSWCQYCKV